MKKFSPSHWDKPFNRTRALRLLRELALRHARLAGPYSEDLLKHLGDSEDGDLDLLALISHKLDLNLIDGLEPAEAASVYYHGAQALAFFQKYEDLPLDIDRQKAAYEKFRLSEGLCKETNARLKEVCRGNITLSPLVNCVIHAASRKISNLLYGLDLSPSSLDFVFGPGATTTTKGSLANAATKCVNPLACSTKLVGRLQVLLAELPHLAASHTSLPRMLRYMPADCFVTDVRIDRAKIAFVPKNAKTDRTIIVEPVLNSLYQRAIGLKLRGALLRVNIDLRSQARNQELAKRGSIDGTLATIDLSMASDTVSRELIYMLFPVDFACLVDDLASSETELEGVPQPRLEKISSMGNGYTFELETLIFWALAISVCEYLGIDSADVSVYGDDIIVPTGAVHSLLETLEFLGFKPNQEKSFWSGKFRESCGKDYYFGIDVRPYFQKSVVSYETLFSLHNYYMRCGDTVSAAFVRGQIPKEYQLFGPDGLGDGHLIGTWVPRAFHRDRGLEVSYFYSFLKKPKTLKRCPRVDLDYPLYANEHRPRDQFGPVGEPLDPLQVRGSEGVKVAKIYTHRAGVFL